MTWPFKNKTNISDQSGLMLNGALRRSLRRLQLPQVALNWVICKGAFPIPGVKNKEQAREVVGATGWRLEASEIAALDEASGPLQM